MRIGILLALLAASLGMQQATPVSLTYPEKPGPGRGRHVVFLTGDEEYRSEEGLPMLAKILSQRHGFKTSVLFSVDEDGTINPFKSGNYVTFAKERCGDFTLSCDFKVSAGCNSGIFIRTGEPKDPVQTGIEIQVLDSAGKEKMSKHDCGAIYDLVAPSKNPMKPAGEWNTMVIRCQRNQIQVSMNGESIAEMDLDQWTEAGKGPDGAKNKFTKALKDFPREGLLGFQDHGKPAWFKNIKARRSP